MKKCLGPLLLCGCVLYKLAALINLLRRNGVCFPSECDDTLLYTGVYTEMGSSYTVRFLLIVDYIIYCSDYFTIL